MLDIEDGIIYEWVDAMGLWSAVFEDDQDGLKGYGPSGEDAKISLVHKANQNVYSEAQLTLWV